MQIPFTTEEFLDVIKNYNQNIFPSQIIFYVIGLFMVYLLFKEIAGRDKIISSLLSLIWLWTGVVYHIIFFTTINQAAYWFGILFILQAIIFFIYGVVYDKLQFKYSKNIFNYTGIIFILYALLIYPLLGYSFGRQWPYSITLGLPCPSTIFTFGILLFIKNKISYAVLILPLLWAIIGFSAAFNFSVYEDFGLVISGIIGFILLAVHNKIIKYVVKPL
jgi:hypothetical protein